MGFVQAQQNCPFADLEAGCFFLMICACTGQAPSTTGILFQKYVYITFSMKMVLNCVHIWSVDLLLVNDKAPERVFVRMQ